MQTVVRLEVEHVCTHAAITFTETQGAIMDCQVVEKYRPMPRTRVGGWRSVLAKMLRVLRPGYPKLDLEVMSDHMKRDMGFMDGRAPRHD
ncbi:hypothetical protein JNB71_05610 [Rhizobium herbae]|uniref:Uncharacterized protein n=1 Tax=Rhizobium herbae TaxID=508661 RepID=A0ABS7H8N0_9HYPH|nr:hypothetical protein [Rhizobium herbae]MBW9062789.1 hypothetical protein [Rhizobium herbae]